MYCDGITCVCVCTYVRVHMRCLYVCVCMYVCTCGVCVWGGGGECMHACVCAFNVCVVLHWCFDKS